MITARLNRLVQAYRQAKALIGNANRGLALPGPAFRMCHKLRRAVWAEIHRVGQLIPRIRTANKRQERAMNETGESSRSINARQDDRVMLKVISALQDGARLKIDSFIRRAYVEGLPDRDHRNGTTITVARLKRLEKEKVIQEVGMDRYAMNPHFELGELG